MCTSHDYSFRLYFKVQVTPMSFGKNIALKTINSIQYQHVTTENDSLMALTLSYAHPATRRCEETINQQQNNQTNSSREGRGERKKRTCFLSYLPKRTEHGFKASPLPNRTMIYILFFFRENYVDRGWARKIKGIVGHFDFDTNSYRL